MSFDLAALRSGLMQPNFPGCMTPIQLRVPCQGQDQTGNKNGSSPPQATKSRTGCFASDSECPVRFGWWTTPTWG
jgi:hypothetical protein